MNFLLHVALNTVIIYLFVILLLRTVGRRQLSQLSAVDLLVVLLLGSAVETSMVTASTLLRAGLVSAFVLLVANKLITIGVHRSRLLKRIFTGGPVLIVHDGELVRSHCRSLGLSEDDVLEALREREQCDIKDIRFAVFEPNGEINVVPYGADAHQSKLASA